MSKNHINQSAMESLIGGLTSSIQPEASSSSKPSSPKRGRAKRSVEAEQVTMFIDKSLMDKVRALAFQEGFSIKEIFTAGMTQFIDNFEAKYGKLPVARSKSGGIQELMKK